MKIIKQSLSRSPKRELTSTLNDREGLVSHDLDHNLAKLTSSPLRIAANHESMDYQSNTILQAKYNSNASTNLPRATLSPVKKIKINGEHFEYRPFVGDKYGFSTNAQMPRPHSDLKKSTK